MSRNLDVGVVVAEEGAVSVAQYLNLFAFCDCHAPGHHVCEKALAASKGVVNGADDFT
jgi:hypothetical protein